MHKDPTIVRKETDPKGPIGKLPKQVLDSLDGFYKDAVEGGLYDPNGGGRKAATADMEWYQKSGQLKVHSKPSSSTKDFEVANQSTFGAAAR